MSEMIERVAMRIASVNCPRSWAADGPSPMSDDERRVHRAFAAAAIEAMREPTEAQYEALSATNLLWRQLDSRRVWQTYIDAALAEPTP